VLQQSKGIAVSVTDDDIMDAFVTWACDEGVFAAPEGAASYAAYRKLLADGFFTKGQEVVLFNTGSGLKYLEIIADYLKRKGLMEDMAKLPASRNIGGMIQPN
jgi:threonine synthase